MADDPPALKTLLELSQQLCRRSAEISDRLDDLQKRSCALQRSSAELIRRSKQLQRQWLELLAKCSTAANPPRGAGHDVAGSRPAPVRRYA
jgi:hypothetical protein